MPSQPPSEGLRERKKRATRAALAEAAVRLAAEHGAEHVTVEAISEAAGVSPRTFFNYFDTRDDAFVTIDGEIGDRIRRGVLEAPASLAPLDAVRKALAAELSDVEKRHELWDMRAKVLQKSPHLLVRSLSAHMADEAGLARAIAQRTDRSALRPEGGPEGGEARRPGKDDGAAGRPAGADASAPDGCPGAELELYPRLLAAVGSTAVRVSIEHWCAQAPDGGLGFPEIFHRVFAHLAAGLPDPAGPCAAGRTAGRAGTAAAGTGGHG